MSEFAIEILINMKDFLALVYSEESRSKKKKLRAKIELIFRLNFIAWNVRSVKKIRRIGKSIFLNPKLEIEIILGNDIPSQKKQILLCLSTFLRSLSID